MSGVIWIAVLVAVLVAAGAVLLRYGTRWGSTSEERARPLPGDRYLDEGRGPRVVMTRSVSLRAPPAQVWPWIAQTGRGAGWYSYDWLDNGRKASARHVVSWIPPPRRGDASPIGYLREVNEGRYLVWWLGGLRSVGAWMRSVIHHGIEPEGDGTRLVTRVSVDATGPTARLALLLIQVLDSIMARRQLLGIRKCVEAREEPDDETGARDQYQLYEVLYADGTNAGVAGREQGARWRRQAIDDGVIDGGV